MSKSITVEVSSSSFPGAVASQPPLTSPSMTLTPACASATTTTTFSAAASTNTAAGSQQSENKRKRKLKNPSQGKLQSEIASQDHAVAPATTASVVTTAPVDGGGCATAGDADRWTKKCEFCSEAMSISLLIPHIANAHNKENVRCPICGTEEGLFIQAVDAWVSKTNG